MSKLLLVVTLPLSALAGCTSLRPDPDPAPCSANAHFCSTYEFAAASEEALRTHPGKVEVECPLHPYSPPAETVMPECIELVKAAILLANEKHKHALERPISLADVVFEDHVAFLDTFVPGNEARDEHTVIYATIPLRWKD